MTELVVTKKQIDIAALFQNGQDLNMLFNKLNNLFNWLFSWVDERNYQNITRFDYNENFQGEH